MWIQSLKVLDDGVFTSFPRSTATGGVLKRIREIRRLACLKAAATVAAGKCLGGSSGVKTTGVLKVAEAFER